MPRVRGWGPLTSRAGDAGCFGSSFVYWGNEIVSCTSNAVRATFWGSVVTALDARGQTATAADPAAFFRPIAAVAAPIATTGRVKTLPAPVRDTATSGSRTSPTVMPRMQPSLERRRLWERRFTSRLRTTDIVIVVLVTVATALLNVILVGANSTSIWGAVRIILVTTVAWIAFLSLFRTRSQDAIGSGAGEYKRVAHATGSAFGILAILSIIFKWDGVRLELLVALPVGLLALLITRRAWRRWLITQRQFGHYASRVVVAGTAEDVEYVIRNLDRQGALGYIVVGAATPHASAESLVVDGRSYPVVGSMQTVSVHARELSADAIIVASPAEDDPDFIKRLSWDLEGTASELILSSRLADVAGPRISLRPVDGLPLIHVKIPRFEGGAHALKRAMDVLLAAIALVPIALITPVLALLIKADDRGPVFFRQTRIGRDGREFGILKFRTMRVNAEAELTTLKEQNEGSGLLFKMKSDPRITRVGAVLRKFSLDELPQFWNVLRGDMSIVGPRPPLPSEVHAYDGTVYRRLYIKPGITGLWQVSGRSDLSWDESVRLDLRYVENWSVMTDLMIMWRTARVMISPTGAY